MQSNMLHIPIYIYHPSMLWTFNQYTKTRFNSSGYI